MDAWLQEALFHGEGHEVLGLELAPLCARHLLVLESVGSGYVCSGPEADESLEGFLFAVCVCTCKNDAELSRLLNGEHERELNRIVSTAAEMAEARRAEDSGDKLEDYLTLCLFEAEEAFRAYWKDYMSIPEIYPAPRDPKAKKRARPERWQTHPVIVPVMAVVRSGYCRARKAWWLPYGEVFAMHLAALEMEGMKFRIYSDADRKQDRELGYDV